MKSYTRSLLTGALLAACQMARPQDPALAQTASTPMPAADTSPILHGVSPLNSDIAQAKTDVMQPTPAAQSNSAAKPKPTAPVLKPGYQFFGSARLRLEDWNWFPTDKANGAYTFLGTLIRAGVMRQTRTEDVTLELAAPILAGLPTRAIATAPQGALGQGANYRDANHGQIASLFVKQAFVRFKNVGAATNSLRLGRFEFADGSETTSADTSLSWIKQNRIAHRLIGPFTFTHVGRSLDGLQFVTNTPRVNTTLIAAFPTRGVFDVNGMDTLTDIKVGYAAATYPQPGKTSAGEGRLFAIYYEDTRDGAVVKVDNRPLTSATGGPNRSGDKSAIRIGTFGGNYTRVSKVGDGKVDGLLWGAAQIGKWGQQRQGAVAFAAEAGYQPNLPSLKPWLRIGFDYYSGDGNANNQVHGTFVPLLPTPRIYARYPFFTESNLEDLFAQAILRPTPRLTLRGDLHSLKLADSHDLWYTGGGAYEIRNFGYAGRPSSGHSNLATLIDLSVDYQAQKNLLLSFYIAYARGGDVIRSLYKSIDSPYAYAEATYRF